MCANRNAHAANTFAMDASTISSYVSSFARLSGAKPTCSVKFCPGKNGLTIKLILVQLLKMSAADCKTDPI